MCLVVVPFIDQAIVVHTNMIVVRAFQTLTNFKKSMCEWPKQNFALKTGKKASTTTSTTEKPDIGVGAGCQHEGRLFPPGARVPSNEKCEHCYCLKDTVVCAIEECAAPCEGCEPVYTNNKTCCPQRYECRKSYSLIQLYENEINVETKANKNIFCFRCHHHNYQATWSFHTSKHSTKNFDNSNANYKFDS